MLPTCARYGMGVIVWSPLNGGWLTGKYKRGQDYPKGTRASWGLMDPPEAKHNQRKFDAIEQLEKVAADAGISLTHLAIAWSIAHPAVTSTIIGPKTMEQLDDLLGAADVDARRRHARPHRRDRPARPHAARPRRRLRIARTSRRPPAAAEPTIEKEHTMEHRRLGRTALRVSELCLGTMNFGPLTTQDDSFVIMDRALELGINFFDTANRYGGPKGAGHDRDDHRQLVRAGRRPPREGRARDEGVRPDDRLAERRRALGPPHPRRVRSQPAPPADRPHRPLPDAPRRPERAVGRGVAGDGERSSTRARSSTSAAATSRAGTSRRPTKPPRSATSSAS